MIGVTPDGAEVEVDRGGRPAAHPLVHATIAEMRSAMVNCFRADDRYWADIAKAMRCSTSTCQNDAAVPLLRLHGPRALADAG